MIFGGLLVFAGHLEIAGLELSFESLPSPKAKRLLHQPAPRRATLAAHGGQLLHERGVEAQSYLHFGRHIIPPFSLTVRNASRPVKPYPDPVKTRLRSAGFDDRSHGRRRQLRRGRSRWLSAR